jgi:nickel-dependent lactate racemase
MHIEISYSSRKVGFDIPKENLAGVIRPGKTGARLSQSQINLAISGSSAAEEFVRIVQGKNLCILLPDGTRDLPIDKVLKALASLLDRPRKLRFMICTGTHDAVTERNKLLIEQTRSLMQKAGIKNFDIIVHDCDRAEFTDAGMTSRQTSILYNAAIKDMDVFLALSDIKHHYFAGYSNPVKNFVPGLCAYKTAEGNHALSLDERSRFGAHPWHLKKELQDNPLAADQVEAMEKIIDGRPFWTVAMISTDGNIQWLRFSQAKEASAEAFSKADEWNIHEVKQVERMLVSCGGTPNDIDLYIAQRALELTKQAIADGGEILFVCACDKGIGAQRTMEHFWNLLTRPMDDIAAIVRNGPYKLFSHKPLRFAELIGRLTSLWVYSELDDELIKAGHMSPASNIQDIVDRWISQKPDIKILVVDGANKLAIRSVKN